MAEYEFLLRHPTTLELVGELRPQDIVASWNRRDAGTGKWSITIPRSRVSLSLLQKHSVLEIKRDGVDEFLGVLESRRMDATGKLWHLGGRDSLFWWLMSRVVGESAADVREGAAEDVLTSYVEDYLGSGAIQARRATTYIPGKTWDIEVSGSRGEYIYVSAEKRNLDKVAEEICTKGLILPTFSLTSTGYQMGVATPRDATSATGAVPFGLDWDNVEELEYSEDFREYKNHLYILGEGSGDARPVTEVYDADDEAANFRREMVVDARYATDEASRTAEGQLELYRQQQGLVSVKARPFRGSQNAVYREDWDVGWNITFQESELLEEPIDLRVVAASVDLSVASGEDITFEIGQYRANSQMRRLEEALRKLRVASVG